MGTSLAFFGLSSVVGGIAGASFYMLAVLAVPVSIGIAIATVVNRRLGQTPGVTRRWRWLPERSGSAEVNRCSGCGAPRTALGLVWVCRACDLVSLNR